MGMMSNKGDGSDGALSRKSGGGDCRAQLKQWATSGQYGPQNFNMIIVNMTIYNRCLAPLPDLPRKNGHLSN